MSQRLKELYESDVNIMEFFREKSNTGENELDSILYSYDLQSGSYTDAYNNKDEIRGLFTINEKLVNLRNAEFKKYMIPLGKPLY